MLSWASDELMFAWRPSPTLICPLTVLMKSAVVNTSREPSSKPSSVTSSVPLSLTTNETVPSPPNETSVPDSALTAAMLSTVFPVRFGSMTMPL